MIYKVNFDSHNNPIKAMLVPPDGKSHGFSNWTEKKGIKVYNFMYVEATNEAGALEKAREVLERRESR